MAAAGGSLDILGDLSFNMHHGFLEALVRGLRSTFLTDADYASLQECSDMKDFEVNLQETDYGSVLEDEDNPTEAKDPKRVRIACRQKVADEFEFLRSQASAPLSTFLDFVSHEYMISTVLELLKLAAENSDSTEDEFRRRVDRVLKEQANPLGRIDDSTAKAITAFGTSEAEIEELYATVLVDTPVGRYFERFLAESAESGVILGGDVASRIREQSLDRFETAIRKIWMEDFRDFCKDLGGETAEQMDCILSAQAAAMQINITYNTTPVSARRTGGGGSGRGGAADGGAASVFDDDVGFGGAEEGSELTAPAVREDIRRECFPCFGPLYPGCCEDLARAASEDDISRALAPYKGFSAIWSRAERNEAGDKLIHEALARRDMYLLQRSFEGHMHFAMFYAYVKLKLIEARNVGWIAQQISSGERDFGRIVVPFSKETPIGPEALGDGAPPAGSADFSSF